MLCILYASLYEQRADCKSISGRPQCWKLSSLAPQKQSGLFSYVLSVCLSSSLFYTCKKIHNHWLHCNLSIFFQCKDCSFGINSMGPCRTISFTWSFDIISMRKWGSSFVTVTKQRSKYMQHVFIVTGNYLHLKGEICWLLNFEISISTNYSQVKICEYCSSNCPLETNYISKLLVWWSSSSLCVLSCLPQGDFTWSSLSGRSVRLMPVSIQSLSELERNRLQEVAYTRLHQEYDLGCQITMPKGVCVCFFLRILLF